MFIPWLTVAIAVALNYRTWVLAYEEHPNFCIDTNPMFISDMETGALSMPTEKPSHCRITAITLTAKEQESFIDTMCKDHGGTHKDNYYFFKLHNGELMGRGSFHDICNNASSIMAWVPYKVMLESYGAELNPKERLSYIAKATSVERQRTELCHFRHTDMVNDIADNLFTCIVMIFEDNFYGLEDNINVLVELQPLMYQMRNITYMPWRNVTNSYKTRLGSSVLKNPSGDRKPIYGSLNYAFVEKIMVNTSSVYINERLHRLPLLFEHRGSVVELDDHGIGGINVEEKAFFGRTMDARSEVNLQVIGQWVDQHRQFTADIYEYFGHGLRRYKQQLLSAQLTFVRIDSTEPVFETPESTNLAKASLFKEQSAFARLNVNGSGSTEWDSEVVDDEEYGHPYPGFYPWFVLSCLVLATALVLAVYGIARVYSKKSKETQKYELTCTE